MNTTDLIAQRLTNQHLTGTRFTSPEEATAWLGAVQSQDYHGAKWAIGQRLKAATSASVDDAFNRGEILRTHVLRPTWHFVTPADIRWILELTAPKVQQLMAGPLRQQGLDAPALTRYMTVLITALGGDNALTRPEIFDAFAQAGIPASGQVGVHILMHAELERLIVSGPLRGKHHTYMLLDERAPSPTTTFDRDEALANLAIRYFQSHGPGTPRDLAWWSSLNLTDTRRAVQLVSSELDSVDIDGTTWWASEFSTEIPAIEHPHVRLLPNYDEYFSRDGRTERYDGPPTDKLTAYFDAGRFDGHHVIINGRLRGGWRRHLTTKAIRITVDPFDDYTPDERSAVETQAELYATFMDLPLDLTWIE
jgi:hypothetical protein